MSRQHSRALHGLLLCRRGRGFADLLDQLPRSAASIPANVLEGMGEERPRKRLQYMHIAKGSAYECWAHTDTLIDFGLVQPPAVAGVRARRNPLSSLIPVP